jgi:hypothetical protein
MEKERSELNPLSYGFYLVALLALIFDVGYFGAIDINLFTNFSISEHFLFSVEALPTALLVVFAFLGIYFLMKLFLESAAFRKNMTTKRLRFLYLFLLGFLIVFSVVNNRLLEGSVVTTGFLWTISLLQVGWFPPSLQQSVS